ncbi:MAG TPA: hypothetical protein VHC42_08245 [Rhizomicrobium sp.]|nr:hypothetical protein [Rhizomicrobium sp.]
MKSGNSRRWPVAAASLAAIAATAMCCAALAGPPVRHVSGREHIIGPSRELSAMRPAGLAHSASQMTPRGRPANSWTKLANLPGAVVHDVAFVSASVGYAAAELGQVWKTSDGGAHWTEILNRGFPYYYYGAYVTGHTVIVSGFNDTTGEAILSRSDDDGASWQDDDVLSSTAWAGRVRFAKGLKHGLVMNGSGSSGTDPNIAWWSAKGRTWRSDVPDPEGGWFGNQFTLLKNGDAFASGITFCKSGDAGATWSCAPPADSVFDGPTDFIDDKVGWTGGGEIAPQVAGWLHRTRDGGLTWSDRVLNSPWPIREVDFLDKKVGWAAGGDVFSNAGGIYFSKNGGKSWTLDVDTGDEMGACAHQPIGDGSQTEEWCIGFLFNGSSYSSEVYSTVVDTP